MSTIKTIDSFLDGLFRPFGRFIYRSFTPSPWQITRIPFVPPYVSGDPLVLQRGTIKPLYFVQHPAGFFSVAQPQPAVDVFGHGLPVAEIENKQLRFLLSQAPMQDAPKDLFTAGRAVTKYAYVNPKTFAKFTSGAYTPKSNAPYIQVRPSPTKWVISSLMPENQVIYTPNPLPGVERLLAS